MWCDGSKSPVLPIVRDKQVHAILYFIPLLQAVVWPLTVKIQRIPQFQPKTIALLLHDFFRNFSLTLSTNPQPLKLRELQGRKHVLLTACKQDIT